MSLPATTTPTDTKTPADPDAPACITQAEWDEVLTFVRELQPVLAQFSGLGKQVQGGGLATLAAAIMQRKPAQ